MESMFSKMKGLIESLREHGLNREQSEVVHTLNDYVDLLRCLMPFGNMTDPSLSKHFITDFLNELHTHEIPLIIPNTITYSYEERFSVDKRYQGPFTSLKKILLYIIAYLCQCMQGGLLNVAVYNSSAGEGFDCLLIEFVATSENCEHMTFEYIAEWVSKIGGTLDVIPLESLGLVIKLSISLSTSPYCSQSYQSIIKDMSRSTDLDEETCKDVFSLYLEQARILLLEAYAHLEKDVDYVALQAIFHKLKGSSGNVRAHDMMILSKNLEEACKTKTYHNLEAFLDDAKALLSHYESH